MKETFYFSHDYNTKTDPKIKKLLQKHGFLGYGIFWSLVEDLYQNANALPTDYDSIAYDLRSDYETIRSIVNDFGLFESDDKLFWSTSIERRLNDRNDKSEKAKKSAEARWAKKKSTNELESNAFALESNANALQPECDSNAIKESKVKEIKEKESKVNNTDKKSTAEIFLPKISATHHEQNFVQSVKPETQNPNPPVPAAPPPQYGDGDLQKQCREFKTRNDKLYPAKMYIDFLNYWTAPIQNGLKKEIGKERWKVEKTFQLASRLSTWYNRTPNQYQNGNNQSRGLNTAKNLGSTAVFPDNKDYSGTDG